MNPTPVSRFMFTVDEVVAAVLPNVGHCREMEMRIDADGYVVIDIVNPQSHDAIHADAPAEEPPSAAQEDDFPGDQPLPSSPPPAQEPADREQEQRQEPGPRQREALGLCQQQLFRAFLGAKNEEAAIRILTEQCHVRELADLDRGRSNGMNLRHVVEEFEAWKIT